MKIATTIISTLIALLSIAAGAAKIMLVPEEAEFLAQFGFTEPLTITFGIAQALGGVLIVAPALRLYGACICAALFSVSAILISTTGDLLFAGVSLLPVLFSGFIIYQCTRTEKLGV